MTWTPEQAAEAEKRDIIRAAQKANAEPALPSLLSADDPDWDAFQADDPDWFLRAAGQAIRKYVGWHIYPNTRETVCKLHSGSRGIIMLPSRHVTEVDSLTIQMNEGLAGQWVNPNDYVWHEAGYIERKGWAYYAGWSYVGGYYGNDPYYSPVWNTEFATVTMWHGYATLPEDVKEVAFELAEQSMMLRAGGPIRELDAPGGYKVVFSGPLGLTLSTDQKARLANYRIGWVA